MSFVKTKEVNVFKKQDLDGLFASPVLSDLAYKAARNTQAKFDSRFPGWALYRRVVAGIDVFDRDLEAWSISMARGVARGEKSNGRSQVSGKVRRKGEWIAQAGRDGLDFAIFQKYAEGAKPRAERFGIDYRTYQRVRDAVAGGMTIGLNTFRSQLHAEYISLFLREKCDPMENRE